VFCVLFAASWTPYLNTVSEAGPVQRPCRGFFELIGYCIKLFSYMSTPRVLVRYGVEGTTSDHRRYDRPVHRQMTAFTASRMVVRLQQTGEIPEERHRPWRCAWQSWVAGDRLMVAGWGRCFGSVLPQGFLGALGAGASDAMVNRECLPQVCVSLAQVAVSHVGLADSFQSARFL
jgi:hypothetical protein